MAQVDEGRERSSQGCVWRLPRPLERLVRCVCRPHTEAEHDRGSPRHCCTKEAVRVTAADRFFLSIGVWCALAHYDASPPTQDGVLVVLGGLMAVLLYPSTACKEGNSPVRQIASRGATRTSRYPRSSSHLPPARDSRHLAGGTYWYASGVPLEAKGRDVV